MKKERTDLSDHRLIIERLTLWGFGPFRGRVDVRFPTGLGVLVAPNERGKSTLIAGISAILFGLSAHGDADAFSVARFRNNKGPTGAFEGELRLQTPNGRFRIYRHFDSHRVRVALQEHNGWRETVVGEHNPNARKPNARYEEWLTSTIGYASRSVFETTFCLTDLPDRPDAQLTQVQELLTGTETGGPEQALARLLALAKEVTQFTGRLGLTPRDGRKLGRLQEVKREMDRLERVLNESRTAVDDVHRIAEELSRRDGALDQERHRLGELQRLRDALRAWGALKQRVEEREMEVAALKRSVRAYHSHDERRIALIRQRQAEVPEFEQAPGDVEEVLGRLAEVHRLAEEVAHVRREWERLDTEVRQTNEAAREAFDLLVEEPATKWVDSAEEAWRCVREQWGAFVECFEEWQAVEFRRQEEADALLEAAAVHDERLLGGASIVESERGLGEAAGVDAWAKALREQIEASLTNESERAGVRKRLVHKSRLAVRYSLTSVVMGAIAVVMGGALVVSGRYVAGVAVASLGLVGAMAVWMAPGARAVRRDRRALAQRVVALENERSSIVAELGAMAGTGRSEREAFVERIDAHRQAMATLERRGAELVQEMRDMERSWTGSWSESDAHQKVELSQTPCSALVGPWRRFADAMATMGRQASTVGELADLAAALDEGVWQALAYRAGRAERLRAEADRLEAMRQHLAGADGSAAPAGVLKERLAEIDRGFAHRWTGERAAWDEVWRHARSGSVQGVTRALPEAYAALLRAASWNLDGCRSRWQRWSRLKREEERERDAQEAILRALGVESQATLEGRLAAAEARLSQAVTEIERLRAEHPQLPSWQDADRAEAIQARVHSLQPEIEALQRQIDHEEETLLELRRRLARLQGSTPINVAAAEVRLARLEQERARLETEAQALALAHRELSDVAVGYYSDHTHALADAASAHFVALTGRRGRRVCVGDQMRHWVVDEEGAPMAHAQLSAGTRDQLHLAMRLAVADLLAGERRVPFIFDDPFLTYDTVRTRAVQKSMMRLASMRQVIIVTHREELGSWGEAVEVSEGDVLEGFA